MILSTENGALRSLVGERRAIEILAKAGFDAIDYTFTPWMERGEMPWNRDGYQDYAKEVVQMAKDNGVYFNQAHAPFIFHTSYLPDWMQVQDLVKMFADFYADFDAAKAAE